MTDDFTMTIEEAAKVVFSLGLVVPEFNDPDKAVEQLESVVEALPEGEVDSYVTRIGSHGDFNMGEKTGQGRYDFHNGAYYEGELYCSMKDGKGILKTELGEVYNGHWKDDIRHGQGVLRMANGDSYKGEFSHNMKDGYGVLREGRKTYKGHFKHDKKICNENDFDKQKADMKTRDT